MEHLQHWARAKYMAFRVPPYRTESMAVFVMMPENWVHKQSSESEEERLEKRLRMLACLSRLKQNRRKP